MHQSYKRLYCLHLSKRLGQHSVTEILKGRPCVTPTAYKIEKLEKRGGGRGKQHR